MLVGQAGHGSLYVSRWCGHNLQLQHPWSVPRRAESANEAEQDRSDLRFPTDVYGDGTDGMYACTVLRL